LDHFKQVNDTYGHGAGDFVLRTFGERVNQTLRSADVAGRIGGEEFLIVLPETDMEGALLLAERVRTIIEKEPMVIPDGELTVTCSLGVAEIFPEDKDAGVLLARADGALYEAKRKGRNRVMSTRI
jgi:diguanylate cyclase (GGDEF)-like protein